VTDDTAALNAVFAAYSGCKIIFVDQGVYYVTGTLHIPAGTQIGEPCFFVVSLCTNLSDAVGEGWPTIMGGGSFFEDYTKPQPVLQLGAPGSTGVLEISDMVFSTRGIIPRDLDGDQVLISLPGPAAGAIILEWNAHDPSGSQGVVGAWNSHVRIGGAQGTNLGGPQCAATGATPNCYGAFMSLHVTSGASAYIEVSVMFFILGHGRCTSGFRTRFASSISLFS
jgi:glucan 1,3-beta-glucosidase